MPYYHACPECGLNLDPGEICDCKEKPGKRWDAIVDRIIWTVIAIVIGYLLARFGIS